MLIDQNWHVNVMGSIGERLLWISPCLSRNPDVGQKNLVGQRPGSNSSIRKLLLLINMWRLLMRWKKPANERLSLFYFKPHMHPHIYIYIYIRVCLTFYFYILNTLFKYEVYCFLTIHHKLIFWLCTIFLYIVSPIFRIHGHHVRYKGLI